MKICQKPSESENKLITQILMKKEFKYLARNLDKKVNFNLQRSLLLNYVNR